MNFLLIHGSWHDGSAWQFVAEHLRQQGHQVFTPTVAGHGKGADLRVSHSDCVDSIVDYVRDHDLENLVALGHSWGGTILQRLAEIEAKRLNRIIFHNAFILNDGEALFDLVPPHYQKLWKEIETDDGGIPLPFPIFREAFIGDLSSHDAERYFQQFVSPTPARSHYDKVILKDFHRLPIPKSWLYATDDIALPPGEYGWHPRLSQRLGEYRLVTLPGSHEVLFSAPCALAQAIILAGSNESI